MLVQIDRCFGFDTAVEEAQRSLIAAMVEASSADKGVGLVRLMGRQSGYIAMQASMASGLSSPLSGAKGCLGGGGEGGMGWGGVGAILGGRQKRAAGTSGKKRVAWHAGR